MAKRLFLLFVCCGMAVLLYAQPKYDTTKWQMMVRGTDTFFMQKPSKADNLLLSGEYDAAVDAYRQMLKAGETDVVVPYNIACAYAIKGNRDSAFFFLWQAIEYDSTIQVLVDPDFVNLLGDVRWKEIEDRQIKLSRMKGQRFRDPKLAKELWRMKIRDQAYYREIQNSEKKLGMKNPLKDSLWVLKKQLNEENVARLQQIIADYGWPGKSMVGRSASNTAFLIIQHSTLEMQKKYKPMLMDACNRGDADWDALALMIDRIETSEGRPQVYGSQVRYNEEKDVYEPFPITDEHNLDKRRKEVGLRPARSYYANWDIDYKVEQNP